MSSIKNINYMICLLKQKIKNIRDNVKIKKIGLNNKILIADSVIDKTNISINGNNNIIHLSKSIVSKIDISITGNNNIINIDENSNLKNNKIRIVGNNHNLVINKNCRFINSSFWFEDKHNDIIIGNGTTCEGAHIAVTETRNKIIIGEDCMMSFGIDIRNGDSHVILNNSTGERINNAGNILIGDHVWIGAHVQILKNTNVESGSVLGIRSLISKNIPENSIAVGNPSRIVKNNIRWERDRTKWQEQ
jgi:acetyltransferase-like isoleucine patch superfamily enzyme